MSTSGRPRASRAGLQVQPLPAIALASSLVCALLVVFPGCRGEETPRDDRPNVVLIVLDTTRPDYLGLHDHERTTSPFLDQLAEDSVVFRTAVSSSSWTAPATASMFTGLYPTHHGIVQGRLAHAVHMKQLAEEGTARIPVNRMAKDVRTLPEVFRAAGYATFGIAANGNIGRPMGFARGFDWFRGIHGDSNREPGYATEVPYGAGREIQLALSRMAERIAQAEPYFLYLHFNDAHEPYRMREPWYEPAQDGHPSKTRAYESEIRYVDETIRDIYQQLELHENTILAVASDHGEAFGEHGYHGHQRGLHGEVNRVVFMISWPGASLRERAPSYRVSLIDVYPTLLDLAGVEHSGPVDGRSLAGAVLRGAGEDATASLRDRVLFAHRLQLDRSQIWAAMWGKWKLITRPDGAPQLFDLERDSREKIDRSSEEPEMYAKLVAELDAFRKSTAHEAEATTVTLDRAELERLRALGYVEESRGEERR